MVLVLTIMHALWVYFIRIWMISAKKDSWTGNAAWYQLYGHRHDSWKIATSLMSDKMEYSPTYTPEEECESLDSCWQSQIPVSVTTDLLRNFIKKYNKAIGPNSNRTMRRERSYNVNWEY